MLKNYFPLVFLFLQFSLFSQIPTENLVLYLPFNGNALDESGNDNNGIVNGATLTEDRFGNPNSAYKFDGNDWIEVLHNESIDFKLTDNYTISCWVKVDNSHEYGGIVQKWINSYNQFPYAIRCNLSATDSYFSSGRYIGGTPQDSTRIQGKTYYVKPTIDTTIFYNITVTFTTDFVKFYINNVLVDTSLNYLSAGDVNNTTNLFIGRRGGTTERFFTGIIDDIRIYNKELTEEEITSIYTSKQPECLPAYVPTNGIIGYWPFCGNALDESGNGNDGTISGATLTEDRFGNPNSAYNFNGTSNYIEVPDSNSLKNLTEITISAWININLWYQSGGQEYFPILHKSNLQSQHGKYALTLKSGGGISHLGEQENGFSYSTWNLNNWYHVVTVIANNTNKIYINGSLISEEPSGVFPNSYSNDLPLLFGMDSPGLVEYSNGNIDDIGIWNRALTEEEITSIYNEGLSLTYVPDDNFEQALIDLGYDDVLDDYVVTSNISGVTTLDIHKKNISNIVGIEDFINLTELNCKLNQITSLYVTKNSALTFLDCSYNQLTSLDVTKNSALTYLDCHMNNFISLDATKNTALTYLDCAGNQLTSLDVTQNIALAEFYCYDNQLTSLDVTQNTFLTDLSCSSNQLTNLNVTKNSALTYLDCAGIQLTSLDVTQNIALTELHCQHNPLTSLDVTQNTALTELICYNNQLISLNLSQNIDLTMLFCSDNQLTKIDITQNTALTYLHCDGNQLISLNVKNGHNSLITNFNAINNPSLTCIQVDNEIYANSGVGDYKDWMKDATATYSEDCGYALGIDDEILSEGLNLYPNPVSNTLSIDSNLPVERVEIYTILGQKVKDVKSNFSSISTVNLSRGIYIIRIFSENGSTVKKLIKK